MSRFLVELSYENRCHLTVLADSESEAKELALKGIGEAGQTIPQELTVTNVKPLDDE